MKNIVHALRAPPIGGADDDRKFLVVTPKRTFQLIAPTVQACDLWISVFASVISEESAIREKLSDIAADMGSDDDRD